MTYDQATPIRYDGIWRPEHHFAINEWICVRYVEHNRQKIEREVYRSTHLAGQPLIVHRQPPRIWDSEPKAQAMCDALNKVEGKA